MYQILDHPQKRFNPKNARVSFPVGMIRDRTRAIGSGIFGELRRTDSEDFKRLT